MNFFVSVANKRVMGNVSPLESTLTKNRGVGGVMVNQQAIRATHPVAAATNLAEPRLRDICFGAPIILEPALRSQYRGFEVEFYSVARKGSSHKLFWRIA